MNRFFMHISTLSAALAGSLVSAIWEGAILVLGVALCLRILPDLSAAARWVVWTNVFLLLLFFAFLPSMDSHLQSGRGFQASPFHLDPIWSLQLQACGWYSLSGAARS